MATLSDLLAGPTPGLRTVLMVDPGTAVTWVVATELHQPAAFLEGGELVLTTGLVMADADAPTWRTYVSALVEAGAAALGFGTGIVFRSVPEGLVEACQKYGLNLLEVPEEVSFASISRTVGTMLSREAPGPAAGPEGGADILVVQQLTRAAAKDDQEAILRALVSVLRGEVLLCDPEGEVLLGPFGTTDPSTDHEMVTACIRRIRPAGLRGAGSVLSGEVRIVVKPVGLTGAPTRYLVMAHNGPLSRAQSLGADLAWSFLNLAVESTRELAAWVQQLVGAATAHLAAGETSQGLALTQQVHRLVCSRRSHPARQHHTIGEGPWRAMYLCGQASDLEDVSASLARAHLEHPDGAAGGWIVWRTEASGTLLLVLGAAERVVGLADTTALRPRSRSLRIGVSGVCEVDALDRAILQARSAVGAAERGALTRWEDLQPPTLTALVDREAGRAFALARLGSVVDDPELLELLEVYLAERGSVQQVATRLGVHRNSVPARLARLRRALGVDLEDPEQRANLWFATSFWRSSPTTGQ